MLASYSYDSLGRRSGVTFGNGTARSYGWDAAGRLAGISVDLAGHSGDTIPIAAFTGVLKVGRVA